MIDYSGRCKAQRIVADLRRDYSLERIGQLMGVLRLYVALADGRHKDKRSGRYLCPSWAVNKILEYGALLGHRRQIIKPNIRIHVAE